MTTYIEVENLTKSFTMQYHRSMKQIVLARPAVRRPTTCSTRSTT